MIQDFSTKDTAGCWGKACLMLKGQAAPRKVKKSLSIVISDAKECRVI
jgi:hypothetical protein